MTVASIIWVRPVVAEWYRRAVPTDPWHQIAAAVLVMVLPVIWLVFVVALFWKEVKDKL
jgi:hypothetical protein